MKRKNWIIPTLLAVALLLTVIWGSNESSTKNEYKTALTNHYQRLFFDVKKHVENVQVALSKALLSESRDQNVLLLSQIMNESYFAQDKLAQMPVTQSDISKTQKFLNQAADYSYSLIKSHLNGEELTSKEREALFNLQKNSSQFNAEFAKLQDSIEKQDFVGKRTSRKQQAKMDAANKKAFQTSLLNIEKNMAKTPTLIYDGPFSEQTFNKKPVGLGDKKVTLKQAKKIATNFLGHKKVKEITAFEEGKDISKVKIPAYTFRIRPENTPKDMAIYMGVSKQGGKVIWMGNPRPASKSKFSMKEAEAKALKFLEEKGYKNMEPNYSLRYDNVALFNFAYKDEDVTIYPDLVKVKIALDNGEIVGFDSAAYLTNHQKRELAMPDITREEARDRVKMDFDIDSIRLAMIPKGTKEVLCYEFKGKYKDSDFIVYINALNGKEEDILQIIKDENGTLTF